MIVIRCSSNAAKACISSTKTAFATSISSAASASTPRLRASRHRTRHCRAEPQADPPLNLYYHEGQAALALRLTEATGMDRAFFANSGTEANEAALKLARAWPSSNASGAPPRHQVPRA